MTKLLNLPNELLLLIAAELEVVERRRFSKTCQKFFHLIRSQQNKERFGIKEEGYEMILHHLTDHACVLRIGLFEDVDTSSSLQCDVLVLAIISTTTDPQQLSDVLDKCTVPREEILWVCCTNALAESMKRIKEGKEYFEINHVTYEAHFEKFNMQFAEELFQIFLSYAFVFENDGFFNESVHNQMEALLAANLRTDTSQWFGTREHRIIIYEEFTRKCCPPFVDEMNRINDSSARLLNMLRQREGANAESDDVSDPDAIMNSSVRRFYALFDANYSVVAHVGNEGFSDMALFSSCIYNYQQLQPQQAAEQRQEELLWMQEKIKLQKHHLEKLQNLEQHIAGQHEAETQPFPQMTFLLRQTEELRLHAEETLEGLQKKMSSFEELKGVAHRQ